MLALTRRAFMGKIPFPVIHIDNGIDFPETYKFRDELAKKWKLDMIIGEGKIKPEIQGYSCCGYNKGDTFAGTIDFNSGDSARVSFQPESDLRKFRRKRSARTSLSDRQPLALAIIFAMKTACAFWWSGSMVTVRSLR